MVHVFRHGGLKEDVQVTAEGLPDGVTCYGAVVGGAVDTSQLVFAAQEGTAAWSGPVRIIGRASIDGKEVIREGRGVTLIGKTDQDEQRRSVVRSTQEVWLSVISSETASAVVSTGQNLNLETSLGGKLQIPVSIERRGQFVGSVKLVTEGLPGIARRRKSMSPDRMARWKSRSATGRFHWERIRFSYAAMVPNIIWAISTRLRRRSSINKKFKPFGTK